VLSWLFLIFRDKWRDARIILQKCPWKSIYKRYWYYTTHGYLMCNKFSTRYYLNISMWFWVQNLFGKIWPPKPYTWRVFLHHGLIWRKNGSDTRMTFSTHKQKSLLKYPLFGGTAHKICMTCMFRCADTIMLRKTPARTTIEPCTFLVITRQPL